jgi:PTH1 family peptidyl-tRNA hydrolase
MGVTLVVGLGNDEARYAESPHNVGFLVVDLLAARWKWERREKKEYAVYRAPSGAEPGALVKCHTYMNESGPKVRAAVQDLRAELASSLIVCDDFALPWGKLRFRLKGSAGGHNGLTSVIDALGTQDFPRLRVGVGPVPEGADPKDYVLRRQPAARMKELAALAADAVEAAMTEGLAPAMNRFNGSGKTDAPTDA